MLSVFWMSKAYIIWMILSTSKITQQSPHPRAREPTPSPIGPPRRRMGEGTGGVTTSKIASPPGPKGFLQALGPSLRRISMLAWCARTRAYARGVCFENTYLCSPLEPASLCGPWASRPLFVSHFHPAWWATDHGNYFENSDLCCRAEGRANSPTYMDTRM